MDTDTIGKLVVIIIMLTGVIKTFIPEKYKKTIPLIPIIIGLVFAFIENINWITMLWTVVTSVGTYTFGKGVKIKKTQIDEIYTPSDEDLL